MTGDYEDYFTLLQISFASDILTIGYVQGDH